MGRVIPQLVWAVFIVFLTSKCQSRDAFQVLGVSRRASNKEIKAAYKSLSLQWHPDKNQGKESAAEKFIEISEAYERIGSEESRRQYIQELQFEAGRGRNGAMHQRHGRAGFRSNNRRHAEDLFAAFEEELAREFTGSFHSHGRRHQFGQRGGFTYSYTSSPDLSLGTMLWTLAAATFVPVVTFSGPILVLLIYCCCTMHGDSVKTKERPAGADGGGEEAPGECGATGIDEGRRLPSLTTLEVDRGIIIIASLDQYSHDMLYLAAQSSLSSDPRLRFAQCDAELEGERHEQGREMGSGEREKTGPTFRGMAVSSRGHVWIHIERESDDDTVERLICVVEMIAEGQARWESNDELVLVE